MKQTLRFTQEDPPPPGSWVFEWSPDGITWTTLAEPTIIKVGEEYHATFENINEGHIRAKSLANGLESIWSNIKEVPEVGVNTALLLGFLMLCVMRRIYDRL